MKKLIFVRHGRAEDQQPGLTDFERSLTSKGKIISHQMAKRFSELEKKPGLLVTSPAFRALETAYIFGMECGIKPEKIKIVDDLYNRASMKLIFEILKATPEETDNVILFGHNPDFTEIPDRLSKEGCEFVTKTSIVCLSFAIPTWSDLKTGTGKIEYFLKPEKSL